MAEKRKPRDPGVLVHWANACAKNNKKLNNWEQEFINDIRYRLAHSQELTFAQEDKLEEIYSEKT